MQQIIATASFSPPAPTMDATADARSMPEGFEALLAALLGIAAPVPIAQVAPPPTLAIDGLNAGQSEEEPPAGEEADGPQPPSPAPAATAPALLPPAGGEVEPGAAPVPESPAMTALDATARPASLVEPYAAEAARAAPRPATDTVSAAEADTPPPAMPVPQAARPAPRASEARPVPAVSRPTAEAAPTVASQAATASRSTAAGPILPHSRMSFAMIEIMAEWQAPDDTLLQRGIAIFGAASAGIDQAAGMAVAETPSGGLAPPAHQLAAAIARAAGGDTRQLTVQLSPQELGTIEIALDIDAESRLSVAILAERPETLELLRADTRALERLLGERGLELAGGGLELGLMNDGQGGDLERRAPAMIAIAQAGAEAAAESEEPPDEPPPIPAVPALPGRLDLSI